MGKHNKIRNRGGKDVWFYGNSEVDSLVHFVANYHGDNHDIDFGVQKRGREPVHICVEFHQRGHGVGMDNIDRFNYVKSKLVRKFPESSENVINTVIESVLILYKKE